VLPGIRPLAEQLRVNRNTVAKAFAELEAQGVVTTEPGRGSFISNGTAPFRKDVRLKLLTEEIDQAVVQAHHLRVSRAEFVRLATERYDSFETQRERASQG
jgi:GntR family transcriptional regulator